MSWSNYIKAVSVPIPIPVELSAFVEDGREYVAVELSVNCHKTGESIKVKTRRPVQPLGMLTNEEAAAVIRDLVRIAVMHEIDEAISIDGDHVFDPHRLVSP